jgi:hypothetical protein
MSDPSEPGAPDATTSASATAASATAAIVATMTTVAAPRERRPYRAPSLRHLGCVRDLALGGASGVAEGAGTFGPRKMM